MSEDRALEALKAGSDLARRLFDELFALTADPPGVTRVSYGKGEREAFALVADAGKALGSALSDVVNVLDADTIVLGGLYATLAPWLAEPLERSLADQVVASTWRPVQVRASKLGPDAAVRGAAAWIVQRVLAAPGVRVAP